MEKSIQEKGFDDMLIIPGNISLPELSEKMKMESGFQNRRLMKTFLALKTHRFPLMNFILKTSIKMTFKNKVG